MLFIPRILRTFVAKQREQDMKRRSPIHAYKRLLANDHDWDYNYPAITNLNTSSSCSSGRSVTFLM